MKKWCFLTSLLLFFLIWFWMMLPKPLFDVEYATIVRSENGEILAGSIAPDGQWRFPEADSVPKKVKTCILQFEDAHFFIHFGVNPVSLVKAFWQNIRSGEIKRGGSTLTMQVARLQQQNAPRTYFQKMKEILLAIRIECTFTKDEILNFYASHAPFGGNVIGLSSASNRYFRLPPHQLSWAQAATLAVLPNRPGLLFPGRNTKYLKSKRDRLLKKLFEEGYMNQFEFDLSLLETLPKKPSPLPNVGKHLLNRVKKDHQSGKDYITTISESMQRKCSDILRYRMESLAANKIYNGAILVIDNESGEVMAYVGNNVETSGLHGQEVDIIDAKRSTGSLLKPFLYVSMMNEGLLLPKELVRDVPVYYNGFHPQNYNKEYMGVVPADEALARSLNVPAVILLDDYKVARFKKRLNELGLCSIDKPPGYYGLSLILGGAESSLWEMAGAYSSLARVANNFWKRGTKPYSKADYRSPSYFQHIEKNANLQSEGLFDAASVWFMFEAMSKVNRQEEDALWEAFESSNKIAWKTGTSYGHRDAWAIGVTPKYTVGVWVGNANGIGRPGLTGATCASPIMFDVFNFLPNLTFWSEFPYDETTPTVVCRKSGKIAGFYCQEKDTIWVPKLSESRAENCPYHVNYWLNSSGKRANRTCANHLFEKVFFKLPPVEAYFYRRFHQGTSSKIPTWDQKCKGDLKQITMRMIYPKHGGTIIIPKELDGQRGKVIFKLAHQKSNKNVYWYLDQKLLGQTYDKHHFALSPKSGSHQLYLIDQEGEELKLSFVVR